MGRTHGQEYTALLRFTAFSVGVRKAAALRAADEDDDEERRQSELFVPILKDVDTTQKNRVKKRMFYLANVEAITDVACVAPDIGGPPNRYFFVHPRPTGQNCLLGG